MKLKILTGNSLIIFLILVLGIIALGYNQKGNNDINYVPTNKATGKKLEVGTPVITNPKNNENNDENEGETDDDDKNTNNPANTPIVNNTPAPVTNPPKTTPAPVTNPPVSRAS